MVKTAALGVAVALAGLAGGASPATAQAERAPTLRVARISAFTGPNDPLSVTVQVINPGELSLEGARIRITTRSRVGTRSELREALDRGSRSGQAGAAEEDVPTIGPGARAVVRVERDAAALGMTRSGVYPMEITLRTRTRQTTVNTAMPYVGTEPPARLSVALLLAFERPSVVPVEGIYPADALERLQLDELRQQAEAVAARAGVPVTLSISGSLLDTLADLSDGFGMRTEEGIEALGSDSEPARVAAAALSALKAAAGAAGEIAGSPYSPASLPALVSNGLGGDILRQIALGRSTVESRLGRAPSTALLSPPDGLLSRATLGAVAGVGTRVSVVGQTMLVSLPEDQLRAQDFGPSRPVALRAAEGITGIVPDAPIADRLSASEQTVLLAQALVAETASSWHELPLFAGERLLLVAGRRLPAPAVLAALLDGLRDAPWVELRTISSALISLPPQSGTVSLRNFAPRDRPHLQAARAARRALATLTSVLSGPLPAVEDFERQVLVSQSREWQSDPRGVQIAGSVARQVRAALAAVTVAPDRRVTLTARSGEVPVTVLNGNDFPVQVRVRLLSPRLGFPEGEAISVPAFTGATTVDVPVVARAAGSYPVDIRVETPDGKRTLASGRLVLRTTAVSRVTLLAVGGGALLLLLSGLRPGKRRRRRPPRGPVPSH